MTVPQPEQRVLTGARRVRLERAVLMKAAAIIAALGIALVVTMAPSPASAQTVVIRDCGDQYVVARYNSDGSANGVWNKQLSDEGTIYTGGRTWILVEGTEGNPDRFVGNGGAQLQVIPCDAELGARAGVRRTTPPPAARPVNDNAVNCNADNAFPNEGTYVHTGYYHNTGNPICEYRPRSNKLGWGVEVCNSGTPTWQDAGYGLDDIHFTGHYTSSGQAICSNEDGLHSSHQYTQEQQLKQFCIREPGHALCN